jgi:DNA-binding Lrp family transcriptional regulator
VTQEIADELGIARQSADDRLRNLEEEGKLSVKKMDEPLVVRSCLEPSYECRTYCQYARVFQIGSDRAFLQFLDCVAKLFRVRTVKSLFYQAPHQIFTGEVLKT